MSLKTLLPNKDFSLSNNEIYFLSKDNLIVGDWVMHGNISAKNHYIQQITEENLLRQNEAKQQHEDMHKIPHVGGFKITHSTASLQGVKQLDRSLFMKGVDLNVMSREAMFKQTLVSGSSFCDGFEAGYNANKNEFTREEAQYLFRLGIGDYTFHEAVNVIRPLSLPSSIIIEGEEITKINW